ncbi:e1-e2 atpase subfamily protein [Cystoisospora suis]|uniref:E1-e2 atpase subfamily protein n=1 Tax=Cystoisospora suis TaxID=483139 RepID=A0A2C6L0J0_9APIC|nr:e1-e2 atpase subfamily protein [Cystoisospora suis]
MSRRRRILTSRRSSPPFLLPPSSYYYDDLTTPLPAPFHDASSFLSIPSTCSHPKRSSPTSTIPESSSSSLSPPSVAESSDPPSSFSDFSPTHSSSSNPSKVNIRSHTCLQSDSSSPESHTSPATSRVSPPVSPSPPSPSTPPPTSSLPSSPSLLPSSVASLCSGDQVPLPLEITLMLLSSGLFFLFFSLFLWRMRKVHNEYTYENILQHSFKNSGQKKRLEICSSEKPLSGQLLSRSSGPSPPPLSSSPTTNSRGDGHQKQPSRRGQNTLNRRAPCDENRPRFSSLSGDHLSNEGGMKNRKILLASSSSFDEVDTTSPPPQIQRGYRRSRVGTLLHTGVYISVLGSLFLLLGLVTVESCIPVTASGKYWKQRASSYIALWTVVFVSLYGLQLFRSYLPWFFHLRCPLSQATSVSFCEDFSARYRKNKEKQNESKSKTPSATSTTRTITPRGKQSLRDRNEVGDPGCTPSDLLSRDKLRDVNGTGTAENVQEDNVSCVSFSEGQSPREEKEEESSTGDHEEVSFGGETEDWVSRTVSRVRHNVFAVALWLFFGVSRRSARSKKGRQQQVGMDSSPLPSRFVLSKVEEVLTGKSSFVPTRRASRLRYMSQASLKLPAETSSSKKQNAAGVLNGFEPDGLGKSPDHEPQSKPSNLSHSKGWQVDERYAAAPPERQKGMLSRVVFWQGRRFTYSPRTESFLLSKSELPPEERTGEALQLLLKKGGLSTSESTERLHQFGWNSVPVNLPRISHALKAEVLDPMFLFQFLLVCNSFYWRSYLASSIWACLAIYGIVSKVIVARTSQRKVQRLVEQGDKAPVSVLRFLGVYKSEANHKGEENTSKEEPRTSSERSTRPVSSHRTRRHVQVVQAKDLVPGDLVIISPGSYVPADLLLLEGGAVLDESELTGETKPIQKLPFCLRGGEGDSNTGRLSETENVSDAESDEERDDDANGRLVREKERQIPQSQRLDLKRKRKKNLRGSCFNLDNPELRSSILFAGTHVISVANEGAAPLDAQGIDPEEHSDKLRSQTEATTTEDPRVPEEELPKPSLASLSSSSTTLNSSVDRPPDESSDLTSSPPSSSSPSYSLALVVRTGNSTARGSLLRRTLFPSLFLFKYDSQLPAVFLIMLAYAAVIIGIIFKFSPNATGIAGWFYAMGSLSQLLPVWTPVLIAGAQAASAQRLQQMKNILTLAPQRIAVCGKVRVVCFDKTGTLTQQGMQFTGLLPTVPSSNPGPLPSGLQFSYEDRNACRNCDEVLHVPHLSPPSLSEPCKTSETPVCSSSSLSVPPTGKRNSCLYFAKHIQSITAFSASPTPSHAVCIGWPASTSNGGKRREESTLLPENYSYLCELGLSTCHALALRTSAPCHYTQLNLRKFQSTWKKGEMANAKDQEEQTKEKLTGGKKAMKTTKPGEEGDTGTDDLYLGSDLEKRILQATRWRLLEVYEGTSDHDNEDSTKDSDVFLRPMKKAGPSSSSCSSRTTKQTHTSRWMIPPHLYHTQEKLPPLLSACSVPHKTRPSLVPSSSSPFHHARQTPATTETMRRIPHASGFQQEGDRSTIEEELSSTFLPSELSYRQSLLEQGGAEVLHIFPFDYSLQRMSVLVKFSSRRNKEDEVSHSSGSPERGERIEDPSCVSSCSSCSSPMSLRKKYSTSHDRKDEVLLFCKGSYESIGPLCTKGLPVDFMDRCNELALQGFYVLALAYRPFENDSRSATEEETKDGPSQTKEKEKEEPLPVRSCDSSLPPSSHEIQGGLTPGEAMKEKSSNARHKANKTVEPGTPGLFPLRRESAENHLHFLCLVLFRNDVKPDAKEAIHQLKQGRVRPVMVTGDSVLTAISVAKVCGMTTVYTPSSSPLLSQRQQQAKTAKDENEDHDDMRHEHIPFFGTKETKGGRLLAVEEHENDQEKTKKKGETAKEGKREVEEESLLLRSPFSLISGDRDLETTSTEKNTQISVPPNPSPSSLPSSSTLSNQSYKAGRTLYKSDEETPKERLHHHHRHHHTMEIHLKEDAEESAGRERELAAKTGALLPLRGLRDHVYSGKNSTLPPLLIGEMRNPKDSSCGLIWRNAADREDVYSEFDVYKRFKSVQHTATESCTVHCDLAVTETIFNYLAETSYSSLMKKSESQYNPDRYSNGSREKPNHQSYSIPTSPAKRKTTHTDKTHERLHRRSLETGEVEPSEDLCEERARLLERGDFLGQKTRASERQAWCQTSTKAGREIAVGEGESHEAYPFQEGFSHNSNRVPCVPCQRSLPLLCWAVISSLLGSNRRQSHEISEKTKKGKRKQLEGHEKEEQDDEEKLLDLLLMRIRIFARMSPAGKRRVVLAYMRRGHVTCMCGDGGNDCAALRAAHAGVAFSKHSASILSPFTATSLNPTAVADLLKEGRCALATALSSYKFLIVYGVLLSMVKVILLIYGGGSCMSQAIYFLMDVAILLGMSKVMIRTRPKELLRNRTPTSSLLGPTTIVSVCLMLLINFLFLVLMYRQLRSMGLGVDLEYQANLPAQAWWMRSDTYEASSCSIWICMQLINTAFVFSLGGMFRERFYRNPALVIWTLAFQIFFLLITILPTSSLSCLMRINCTEERSQQLRIPFVPAWMARPVSGMPLYNPRGHNIFPLAWKVQLIGLSLTNITVNIVVAKFVFSAHFLKMLRSYTGCPGGSDFLAV